MALILDIKVVPQSGKQKCMLDKSGMIKIYLKSVPEAGRANNELCALLSKTLGLPQSAITILLGVTSRKKRIKIDTNLTQEEIELALGIERQKKLIP